MNLIEGIEVQFPSSILGFTTSRSKDDLPTTTGHANATGTEKESASSGRRPGKMADIGTGAGLGVADRHQPGERRLDPIEQHSHLSDDLVAVNLGVNIPIDFRQFPLWIDDE